jgi:hypothetical protein
MLWRDALIRASNEILQGGLTASAAYARFVEFTQIRALWMERTVVVTAEFRPAR